MEIEITVHSTLSDDAPQGQFKLITLENSSVGGLIRKLCSENGFTLKSSYILCDDKDNRLRWSQTLHDCNVTNGTILYLCDDSEDPSVKWGQSCNIWWFLAMISLAIGAGGIIALSVIKTQDELTVYNFGVVMDAGSAHTQIYVYSWDATKFHNTAIVGQIFSKKCPGAGISSYAHNVSAISSSLQVCLDLAKKRIPSNKYSTAPIYLGATAGMRLLDEVNQNQSDAVMGAVRDTIKTYPFKFDNPQRQARILSGEEEGTFGWVTSNYVSGRLGVKPPMLTAGENTLGALDMGGASTQITFYPGANVKMPQGFRENVQLFNQNYTVYTHSFLCFGINEAHRRFKALLVQKNQGVNNTLKNPCGPKGNVTVDTYANIFHAPCTQGTKSIEAFGWEILLNTNVDPNTTFEFEGTSDSKLCHEFVQELYNFNKTCPYNTSCSFNGTYQPAVYGNFYAFSNFFNEMQFLNLTMGEFTLETFQTALTNLCSSTWDQVKTRKKGSPYLPWYCFNGQFISVLLTEAYKFDNSSWGNINFINTISDTQIGWSLGFMLYSSNIIPSEFPEPTISTVLFGILVALFIVFVLIAVGFGCHARRYSKLRQQGIYEKLQSYGSV